MQGGFAPSTAAYNSVLGALEEAAACASPEERQLILSHGMALYEQVCPFLLNVEQLTKAVCHAQCLHCIYVMCLSCPHDKPVSVSWEISFAEIFSLLEKRPPTIVGNLDARGHSSTHYSSNFLFDIL